MNDHLTVGRVAKRFGVTPKTLRYYEALGLLPHVKRGHNNYRYYRLGELNRLRFIQRAKTLGLSLNEIRGLINVAQDGRCDLTRAELRQILDDKIADCTRRIADLVAFREQLEAAAQHLEATDDEGDASCCPSCAAFAPTCGCVPDVPDPPG